jgi:hypothetical protein
MCITPIDNISFLQEPFMAGTLLNNERHVLGTVKMDAQTHPIR